MTSFDIYGRNGNKIAGGFETLASAIKIANLYPAALKIYRSEPVIASVRDPKTGLWSAAEQLAVNRHLPD